MSAPPFNCRQTLTCVAFTDEGPASDSDASSVISLDPEDPMREYILAQRKEEKALKKSKKSKKKSKKSKTEKTSKKRRRDDDDRR